MFAEVPELANIGTPSQYIEYIGGKKMYFNGGKVKVDKYSKEYFYTGEGAMLYGAGFYFSPNFDTSFSYANAAIVNELQNDFDNFRENLVKLDSTTTISKLDELYNELDIIDNKYKEFCTKSSDNIFVDMYNTLVAFKNHIFNIRKIYKISLDTNKLLKEINKLEKTKEYEYFLNNYNEEFAKLKVRFEDKNKFVNRVVLDVNNPIMWEGEIRDSLRNLLEKEGVVIPNELKTEGKLYNYLIKINFKDLITDTGKKGFIKDDNGNIVEINVKNDTKLAEWFYNKGYDGVIHITKEEFKKSNKYAKDYFTQPKGERQVIAFESSQIKTLGNAEDIQGFKDFLASQNTVEESEPVITEPSPTVIEPTETPDTICQVAGKSGTKISRKEAKSLLGKKLSSDNIKDLVSSKSLSKVGIKYTSQIAGFKFNNKTNQLEIK